MESHSLRDSDIAIRTSNEVRLDANQIKGTIFSLIILSANSFDFIPIWKTYGNKIEHYIDISSQDINPCIQKALLQRHTRTLNHVY